MNLVAVQGDPPPGAAIGRDLFNSDSLRDVEEVAVRKSYQTVDRSPGRGLSEVARDRVVPDQLSIGVEGDQPMEVVLLDLHIHQRQGKARRPARREAESLELSRQVT